MVIGLSKLTDGIAKSVNSINDYVEDINLFKQTMGEFSKEAGDYAHELQDLMGIDASQFMRNQAVFMSMANGFGLAREQAYEMSKGLTELAYDFSSLYNVDLEEMFTKLQSAIAGEIEPIRRLGVSLTEATLKELALEKGITKSVEAMTEAEKAQLRYIAIVETATSNNVIGDFARTLESPANAMRVLKQQITQLGRAIGSVFIPIISQVIPYVLAFAKVLTSAIKSLATLVGFKMPDWTNKDWSSGVSGVSGVAEDTADKLGGASKKAKELKKSLMGFDELNVLPSPTEPSSGGASGGIGGGGDLGLDISSVWDEALLSQVKTQTDGIINKFKELGNTIKTTFLENKEVIFDFIAVVGSIGIGIMAWNWISSLGGIAGVWGLIQDAVINVWLWFEKVKLAFTTIGTTFSTSFLPMAGIILGVASVVYVLWTNFDLVMAIIKDFIAKIKLKEKFEAIKEALAPLLQHVAQLGDLFDFVGTILLIALQPAIGVIMGVFNALITVITPLIDIVDGVIQIFAGLGTFLKGVFTGDMNLVKQGISTFANGVMDIFAGMVGVVVGLIGGFIQGFVAYFQSLFTNVKTIVTNIKNNFVTLFDNMFTSVSKGIGNFITWATNGLSSFANLVGSIISGMWNGVVKFYKSYIAPVFTASFWVNAFVGLKNGFNSVVKNMLNTGIDLINKFIRWLNSKLSFSWDAKYLMGKKVFDGGSVQLFRVSEITQRFEDGGFIEDGLFTMNKGEIAGQFDNGKSVVANNYQITEGISKAVYEAITRANSFSSKDITLNATFEVDGDTLGKKVIKYHNGIVNQTGESPLTI
jgi:hypothetical protein